MSMNDPIADLLTRVRNAIQARHTSVDIPASRVKVEICRILAEQGFINGYEVSEEPRPGLIRVSLRYMPDGESVLHGIRRVSKPSLRVYMGHEDIRQVRSGLGVSILTTSHGVMTGKNARRARLGGEVLCEVW
ncbi:MAG: 30S ribosomal protein S8 [Candidatus Hydrogenedens sp.]|nr:30S ribosomal protein S8 [Candidatus Hydrogenedentota bacterium]NLF56913.1 30S ribosomal protein S8 [Candidatus Hydrogenedens sp.]